LQAAFAQAQQDWDYAGGYTAIYPIKVNQHYGVAGVLAAAGNEQFGLEAGSKPELMAVLALAKPGSVIVCNGYKDREFIHLALLGKRLGFDTTIVVEKPSELDMILQEAAKLGVQPGIGVRLRLSTLGAGKWQNSGGDKAKFGLSPRQVLDLVERLRAAGQLDCLQLLHFHMGSQISNLRDIAAGTREVFNLESVEVIKGADSAYAGRGGAGGVGVVLLLARLARGGALGGEAGVEGRQAGDTGANGRRARLDDAGAGLGEAGAFTLGGIDEGAEQRVVELAPPVGQRGQIAAVGHRGLPGSGRLDDRRLVVGADPGQQGAGGQEDQQGQGRQVAFHDGLTVGRRRRRRLSASIMPSA